MPGHRQTAAGDRDFARELFDDPNYLTSANSISLGRLLPQVVYPFYIYSRMPNTASRLYYPSPPATSGI